MMSEGTNFKTKVNIIVGLNEEKIVLINDTRFKGNKREDWKEVEDYLKAYVGSESRLVLKGAVVKANAAQGCLSKIPPLFY